MKDLKGKLLVGTASLAMLGGIALGGVSAFAAYPDTDVQVRFNADVTPPVIDPTALELRALPAFVDFGTLDTGAGSTATVTVPGSGYVKLNDGRATPLQWGVDAKASTLTSGSDVIDDAEITIVSSGAVQEWTPGTLPTDLGVIVGPSGTVITRPASTVLDTDGTTTQRFAETAASDGGGYAIPVSSMKIDVPSTPTSYAGKTFNGKITWTITATP